MRLPRIFRRSSPVTVPLHLAVTVAGEPACVVDVTALVVGNRVSGIADPAIATLRYDYPVFPGRTEGTRMRSLVTLDTAPTVGVWVGDPGAFDVPQLPSEIS